MRAHVRASVRAHVRGSEHACKRACVRACVHAHAAWMRWLTSLISGMYTILFRVVTLIQFHNYIGHNYIGHYYIGDNYIGHNYIDHKYFNTRWRWHSLVRGCARVRACVADAWRGQCVCTRRCARQCYANGECPGLFLTTFWSMPTANAEGSIGSEGSVGKIWVRRVFRYVQTGTGPRRSPSACSEMSPQCVCGRRCARQCYTKGRVSGSLFHIMHPMENYRNGGTSHSSPAVCWIPLASNRSLSARTCSAFFFANSSSNT